MTTQSTTGKQQNSSSGRFKIFCKENPWKGRLVLLTFSLILIITIARLVLTPTIIYGTTSWFKDRGIDTTIEDIKISIFSGTISLVNMEGYKDNQPLFNIGLVDIHWHWTPLAEKTVKITKVVLDNLKIDIEQYSDSIVIGGLHIPSTDETEQTQEEPQDENIKPWAAALGEVVFTNLNICYLQDTSIYTEASKGTRYIDYCVNLEEMTWGGTISYGTDPELVKTDDLPLSSTGHFKLNGLTVTDNKLNKQLLYSESNTLSNVVITGLNNIHFEALEMNSLSALQRDDKDHEDAVRFKQLTVKDISLTNLNAIKIVSLALENPGLYIVKLNKDDWEYTQWIPQKSAEAATHKADEQSKTETTNAEPSAFALAINNIQINDSDFCYLESTTNTYYCFSQGSLDWKGLISTAEKPDGSALSIAGDLILSSTNIHNPKLERDLLDIKSITLNKLDVRDVDKATFETLTIDSLSVLQRGDKKNDSTASFAKLTIDKVDYVSNGVAIDTIYLSGLSSHVSKNKDGSWEYSKWLSDTPETKNSGGEKADSDKSDAKEAEAKKSNQSEKSEPFLVSVKSATIETKKELYFIDNSTKPAMTVGLNQLDFNIKNLDAKKPNSNSPFKLFGKTKRHGTIDIAGTVRPYSEKVSFDAKGKLKGFDMRAATPATKKTIGHIIKSGQLDADLKLLAVDDQLDSNIGLSLYQFHIKPMSKEDSKKLDNELGMPLNQTLVLLRDNDDSIHLDIPITGDINNPDFSMMDAIVKATTKAAAVAVVAYYTPYGLIFTGGNILFNLATALNFDPVPFPAGSAKLPADGEKQLDKLATLLTEKPKVHLALCGLTNNDDVYALYPALKKPAQKTSATNDEAEAAKKEKNKTDNPIKLSKDQTIALNKLATDRQIASKNYLIKSAKINHDRLILCEPEYKADGNSIAGVEVNI